MSIRKRIEGWFRRRYLDPFTVACDEGLFWRPWNQEERLFRVKGLARAKSISRRWVAIHGYGRARILEGHHWWPWEKR